MPTPNVNDRMAFAELAALHGWDTSVEHINDKTTMVAVTYRRSEGEQIIIRFNYLDKMMEAVSTHNGVSAFVMKPVTVKAELSSAAPERNPGDDLEIRTARDEIKAFRDGEEVGYAYAWTDGANQRFWRVFAPLDTDRAKIGPSPNEPAKRKAALILLKEFA
jgi:hypothetical protein